MYTPLKVTTDYSLLKSLIKVDDLISFLCKNNIKACGIVDNNLSGVYEFFYKCEKNNIKPIIGLEVTIDSLSIYLYAKNYDGFKNLLKINTLVEKGMLNIDFLEAYKDNIIVILPFKSNEIFKKLNFYNDLYVSYSNSLEKLNAKVLTKNTVFVNNINVLEKKDSKYLYYLDLLRGSDPIEYKDNYYLNNIEINDTEINEIVNKIDIKFPENKRYIPKYKEDVDSFEFLKKLAKKGLVKRLNNKVSEVYQKRLDYELSVINDMNFVDYFLIVYDYCLYAKKNNILVGPARGSAASSLVCYSIGITEIDPLKYNLLFERFLNPKRITMPDIDVDFDANKRDEVIEYVKEKYGFNCVALGLTYNTLKTKLVLKDVGKILNIDQVLLDKFVKNITSEKSLEKNLENPSVLKYLKNYKELNKLYDISRELENLKKNTSTHAAGVVISSEPLDEIIPIHIDNDLLHTGVTMEYLERIGLLKMDFLGLKNLTTIANILNKIDLKNLNNINLEDKKVFELFQNIDVDGIFQFETPVMRSFLSKFKIESFNDLVVSLALVRPGPKEYIDTFIRRKKNLEKTNYIHKDLESILKETHGIILYQEQIMAILVKIGGYSYSDADLIRRAISKKDESILNKEFNNFVNSSVKNGYDKNIATKIYKQIIKFASYGFNKAHSVAYAYIAYQMAYLKVYFKELFLLELMDNKKDITIYLTEFKKLNYQIMKPSVLNDNVNIKISNKKIYLPLTFIKGINKALLSKIIELDKNNIKDFIDFVCLTNEFLDKDIIINLIDAGALDEFKLNHATMINNLDNIINYASLTGGEISELEKPAIVEYKEFDEKLIREKELTMYGFYITNHPSSKYNKSDYMKLNEVKNNLFKKVKCAVVIDDIKIIKTKNNEDMAFIKASDEITSHSFTVFPKNFNLVQNLAKNDFVIIMGEVSKRFDKYNIIVNNILKDV